MALFVCNYNNMLLGYDYYEYLLSAIPPSKLLYVVDTDDFVVEKIKASDLQKVWRDDLDFVNIRLDDVTNELYLTESDIDFSDYIISDNDFVFGNNNYSIQFRDDIIIIVANKKKYNLVNRRYDYAGHPEDSNEFDESDWWYNSIIVNNMHICDIMGGHSCEGTEFNISYAFRTKKYFVVRAVRLVDGEPTAISFVFRGSELVDVYASGANADVFELRDFKPSDTVFQTKSKIAKEPY